MKAKYCDRFPCNARVHIDFVKGKVDFDYPGGKTPTFKDKVRFMGTTWIYLIHSAIFYLSILFITVLTAWRIGAYLLGYYFPLPIEDAVLYAYGMLIILTIIVYLPFVMAFISALCYGWMKSWFPKFNVKFLNLFSSHTYFYKTVKSLDKPYFEIPLFKNMILDYDVEGDFAKYLKSIDIREHDFVMKDFEPNKYLFKAVFKFKRTPKKGKLFIKFK